MNHLKPYKEYNKVNEELSRTSRIVLNLPNILISRLMQGIFKIYPLLNLRWRELKSGTKDSKYSPIIGGGDRQKFKHEITKITKDDLPANNLKLCMFLRNWNVYSSERTSTGGISGKNVVSRPIVYISKDEIEIGDYYSGYRLRDEDIYSDFKKNDENFPIMIIAAKFDQAEKVENTQQYVDDICLELEDDFPVSAEPRFNTYGDYLYIPIKITNTRKLLKYDESLISRLEEVGDRIKDYLKGEDYNLDYEINLKMDGEVYYFGDKDRFKEIIEEARIWVKKNDGYYNNVLYLDRQGTEEGSLNLSKIGTQHSNDILKLHPEDIRTLLSDLENCSKSNNSVYNRRSDVYKITEDDIILSSINIVFKKIRK